MTLKKRLWLIPLLLAAVIIAIIAILPSFVASSAHRNTIEALASSLTGRQVHIAGKLSLALFPAPQVIASDVTINGPAHETISAQSLTLDIALPALLEGRLAASDIALNTPEIKFPWPLPGGPAAVAPPRWLTTLHGQIANGTITFGSLVFTQVNADLFTGGDSALAVSGNGLLDGVPLTLDVSLGTADAKGVTPVSVNAAGSGLTKYSAHFSGTLDPASHLAGQFTFGVRPSHAMQVATGSANIQADGEKIDFNTLKIQQNAATITGSGSFNFRQPSLIASLDASKLDFAQLAPLNAAANLFPATLQLNASDSTVAGMHVIRLAAQAAIDSAGLAMQDLTATLPGQTELTGAVTIDPAGTVSGTVKLSSGALGALLAASGIDNPFPAGWTAARLTAALNGNALRMTIGQISGSIGPSALTGNVIFDRHSAKVAASGWLHFGMLDLRPLLGLLHDLPAGSLFAADGEITADQAVLQPLSMTHMMIDAAYDGSFNLRRFSALVDGGLAAASFVLAPQGQLSAGQALLSAPTAAPLAALLPAGIKLPALFAAAPLNISLAADGPPTALAASLVATLGDVSLTAAPVVDITRLTAAGPFTLRHPNAIAALNALGLQGDLSWPGAGSIALRSDVAVSPSQISIPDFVLSLGDLTANGKLSVSSDHQINGDITADTLALPPLGRGPAIPWPYLAAAKGQIGITANRVWFAGAPAFSGSAGSIAIGKGHVVYSITQAGLGGGAVSGNIDTTADSRLTANLKAIGINASQLSLPLSFPFTMASGIVSGQASVTANGNLASSLSGTASLNAVNGSINGFSLSGLATALKMTRRTTALNTAATSGQSAFSTFSLTGTLNHGVYQITNAMLQSPPGIAAATGSLNLAQQSLKLNLILQPAVTPPLNISTKVQGGWANPTTTANLKPAYAWHEPKPQTAKSPGH